jgi:protein transport protein SEC31
MLKYADRSANVAFCPYSHLLAMGSVAGAIDVNFSTNSVVEVEQHEQQQSQSLVA